MPDDVGLLVRRIDGDRMRELLVDFANLQRTPERAVATAEWIAGLLRASGAVEAGVRLRDLRTPIVVAGFPGTHRGPTLQFMGYFAGRAGASRKAFAADGCVHGPAVATSAAGLIAATEAARILAAHGPMPGGGLLFTARALNNPADDASDIGRMVDMGIVGQAVVLTSGPATILPAIGQGACRFEVTFMIRETGRASFEGPSSAIDAAHAFCGALRRHQAAAARTAHEACEPETIVVGSVGGGDRFDTVARSSWLRGAWRYRVGRTELEVRGELERIVQRVAAAWGAQATLSLEAIQTPYRLDVTSSPVHDLLAAYRDVWGRDLPPGTATAPNDLPLFLGRGIPAVCHGPLPLAVESAVDEECVSVEDLVRLAEVYARLSLSYLHRETRSAHAKSAHAKYASGDPEESTAPAAGDKFTLSAAHGIGV
jgi:acetylornithine deacetylase/succinyl-diaminopimelate desuccinylase-like protein